MFLTDIARFLQYFRNLFNSFINIFEIFQDFNGIFSKYSFNITVLCGLLLTYISKYTEILTMVRCGERWNRKEDELYQKECLDAEEPKRELCLVVRKAPTNYKKLGDH